MVSPADSLLDELADLVAARLERRRPADEATEHHKPDTVAAKWTDRLGSILEEYYQSQLSLPDGNVVGDRSEC